MAFYFGLSPKQKRKDTSKSARKKVLSFKR